MSIQNDKPANPTPTPDPGKIGNPNPHPPHNPEVKPGERPDEIKPTQTPPEIPPAEKPQKGSDPQQRNQTGTP